MNCGYHRGRSPDHSLSVRSLIFRQTVVQSSLCVCVCVWVWERLSERAPRTSTCNIQCYTKAWNHQFLHTFTMDTQSAHVFKCNTSLSFRYCHEKKTLLYIGPLVWKRCKMVTGEVVMIDFESTFHHLFHFFVSGVILHFFVVMCLLTMFQTRTILERKNVPTFMGRVPHSTAQCAFCLYLVCYFSPPGSPVVVRDARSASVFNSFCSRNIKSDFIQRLRPRGFPATPAQ